MTFLSNIIFVNSTLQSYVFSPTKPNFSNKLTNNVLGGVMRYMSIRYKNQKTVLCYIHCHFFEVKKIKKHTRLPVFLPSSHYLPCYPGAGFGVGEGVVVVFEVVAAGRRHGVELVVGQTLAEMPPRGPAGATEGVVGIVHLVHTEHRL